MGCDALLFMRPKCNTFYLHCDSLTRVVAKIELET